MSDVDQDSKKSQDKAEAPQASATDKTTTSEEKPAQERKEAVTSPDGTTLGPVLVSSLIAAGLAVGGTILYQTYFPQSAAEYAELEARLAKMEEDAQTRAELKTELDSLGERLAAVGAEVSAKPSSEDLEQQVQDRLALTQGQLDALGERIGTVEEGIDQGSGGAAQADANDLGVQEDITSIHDSMDALGKQVLEMSKLLNQNEGRLSGLEGNAPPEDLAETLNSLSSKEDLASVMARIKELEALNTPEKIRHAMIAMAVSELNESAKGSQPFIEALDALAVLMPGDELVRSLRPYAVSGVPTERVLLSRFESVLDRVLSAEWRARYDAAGFWGRMWLRLKGVVRIRPVGEIEGEELGAKAARAERRIADGDLFAAASELDGLSEAPQAVADDWLRDVRARGRLDRLMQELNAKIDTSATMPATPIRNN